MKKVRKTNAGRKPLANRKQPHYVGLRPDVELKVAAVANANGWSFSQAVGRLVEAGLIVGVDILRRPPAVEDENNDA